MAESVAAICPAVIICLAAQYFSPSVFFFIFEAVHASQDIGNLYTVTYLFKDSTQCALYQLEGGLV